MKLFSAPTAFVMIFSASAFLGCNNDTKKEKESESKSTERKTEIQELKKEYKADSIKLVSEAEWLMYKAAAEIKIKANKVKIRELDKILQKLGKPTNVSSVAYLSDLEKKNENLEKRIEAFKREGTDWNRFRTEFDRDSEQLQTSLKQFKIPERKK